jgi:predicted O-methyltransferase YrrM
MMNTTPRWQRLMSNVLGRLNVDPYGNLFEERYRERLHKLRSPRYLVDRLALIVHEKRNPDVPWMTRQAVAFLEAYLTGEEVGFEWGSGNGTLWLLRRSRRVVSVEHHRAWYERIREKLDRSGIVNSDYRFVDEADYLGTIDEFPDAHFDYVVVDGLFRDQALLRSVPKLKPGGWVVFDNANWYLPSTSVTPHSRGLADGPASPAWGAVVEVLDGWETFWTSNGVNDTAIFVKPLPHPS